MTFRCRLLWDFTVYIVAALRLNFKGLLVKDWFAACCAGKCKQMSRELFNVFEGRKCWAVSENATELGEEWAPSVTSRNSASPCTCMFNGIFVFKAGGAKKKQRKDSTNFFPGKLTHWRRIILRNKLLEGRLNDYLTNIQKCTWKKEQLWISSYFVFGS